MKIAIHHRKGSFSDRWIEYCKKNAIKHKLVNAFDSDIISQVNDCDGFMWHHHHADFNDVLVAKQLLFALEQAGVKVFPNFNTGWHFDNKISQKYLLEAINAPVVPSHVFYERGKAIEWAERATFPKVFKLRGGASSVNVQLINNHKQCRKLINKAFKKGFEQFDRKGHLLEAWRRFKLGKISSIALLKAFRKMAISTEFSRLSNNELGYFYVQDFIPNNDFDIRVIVIDDKAFAIKRMVRENDFRASGSGNIVYDKKNFPEQTIQLAFDLTEKLRLQCVGYDFVYDENKNPLIIEMGYGFAVEVYDNCVGFWDDKLNWHEERFNPQEWMLEALLKTI